MSRFRHLLALGAALLPGALAGQGHEQHGTTDSMPLYANLGALHYAITTGDPMAQAYFDQGLRLYWAFNHAEAVRAFAEAERRDPACAMCAFGQALALGPNINAPMDSATGMQAWAAARRALTLPGRGEREEGMIRALGERYDPARSRAAADTAWADAIGRVADRYPEDLDLQAFHAEALMDLSPWRYWMPDGSARPATLTILARIERVLAANPDHAGGCHLLIHAVEAVEPERAVACAERLAGLMPGAGHLVHMPGHIYIRVGRYADAIRANEHAVHADEHFFEGPNVSRQGLYGLGYYPHNWHFMSFAASMSGRRAVALRAARRVTETVGSEQARAQPWLEAVTPVVYYTMVTFGDWGGILAEPLPPTDLRFTTGMAYYGRGVAFAARRRWAEARAALDSVRGIVRGLPDGDNRIAMQIAERMLDGEILLRSGEPRAAVRAFTEAVALEDGLAYTEPPTWYYPARHSLGKALLAAGAAAEAERVYREDLRDFPENGWSLFGLARSLERQGRAAEAREVEARFRAAWKDADVTLSASRF